MKKGTALKEIFNDFLKNELKDIAKQKKIRGYSTLNLSIGTTFDASPICNAL